MSRWIFDWLVVSALLLIAIGNLISPGPLVMLRLNNAANPEAVLALTMLVVVGLGFLKLVFGSTPSAPRR